ncbi:cytochrome-c peroxidase [Notoacmeibacter ruber]|uniref:Cytochrome-c peroxidase n=1 Tax=Notoacmeibacter ruber TaxID=2670375 RepID=A0A3L7JGI3_9HYPH|nr:cytochrome c peroxidase [Notoacmeibacter ruber]RLQ89610.1 cytochrome-c peroxidase [Notoacmeibacter ruber]
MTRIAKLLIAAALASTALSAPLSAQEADADNRTMDDLVPGETYPNTAENKLTEGAVETVSTDAPLARLEPPVAPPDNPMSEAKVELGRMLFFDPRLSGNGTMPCSACHSPDLGWGTETPISFGYPGTTHWRNSQTILNAAYYNKLFWDGSKTSLESQAPSAAHGAVAGNGDDSIMEMRLAFIPEYVTRFKELFGTENPIIADAWRAIAAYQRTIVSDPQNVPFDRFMDGDETALSEEAKRGLDLFKGKANCASCHNGALFSDQQFYDLGVPQNVIMDSTDPLQQITVRWENYSKGVTEEMYYSDPGDMGLYYVTKRQTDRYKFRVPSLRELTYTGPYMHNGTFETLAEVVDFYNEGGGEGVNKTELLKPLGLDDQEKADLVAFLESLSSDEPIVDQEPELPEIQARR